MANRRIIISLGNIGALNDGLGEFSLQIGQRIAAAAPMWRQQYQIEFEFHLRKKFFGLFGTDVQYSGVGRAQQWWPLVGRGCLLWHSLHQLNKTRPPPSPAVRLLTVHDLSYRYGRNAFSTWRHHRRTVALMRRTDAVVAISRYTAKDVQEHLGWRGPLHTVLNGARSFVGAPQAPLAGWQAQDTRPFLFHLSRMNPSKNPMAILGLASAWPEMRILMCGPSNQHTQRLLRENTLPNLEFHLGITDAQKTWAYAQCAGFLFPSLTEGFGLPPIEAMHFGKPTFLSTLTCLPEIGGSAANYFENFEPGHMRSVVERGLQRAKSSGHADMVRTHAAQFNWDSAASDYLALYRQLLKLPA